MRLPYTWTRADESQIELELDYKIELVSDGESYEPYVTITEVQPAFYATAFYAAIDTDPELWPHVESECLADFGASFDYAGD